MKKINNQGTMTDLHFERLQRPDLIYTRNQLTYQSCMQSLQKDPASRNQNELEKLVNIFRTHSYFRIQNSEFLNECCLHMYYESMPKNTLIYKKGTTVNDRLIIVIQGELSVEVGETELLTTKSWGANLLIMGNDCYSEIPDLTVKCKTLCKSAIITKQAFKVNLLTLEISRITKEITLLYSFPIFKSLTYLMIRKFFANSFSESFNCLDIVYTQEAQPNKIYLVINGIFEMREVEDGFAKQVRIYTPGQIIGEVEIIKKMNNRTGTAFCVSDEGELMIFESKYFIDHMLPHLKSNMKLTSPLNSPTNSSKEQISTTANYSQQRYNFRRSMGIVKLKEGNSYSKDSMKNIKNSNEKMKNQRIFKQIRPLNLVKKQMDKQFQMNQRQNFLFSNPSSVSINRSQQKINKTDVKINRRSDHQATSTFSSVRLENINKYPKARPLKIPLKNELLNKFLNQKEEYGQYNNRLRRTVSQILNVDSKSYFNQQNGQ